MALPAGAERLEEALGPTRVDYRQGAFLGVGGEGHELGFIVTIVHDASSAAKAGLLRNDVIVRFGDEKVLDFEGLTKLIGKRKPGDKVQVEVLRGGETVKKEVQLGAWQ